MISIQGFTKKEILDLYSNISKGWNDRLAHVSRVYNLCKQFLKYFPEANEKILLTSSLLHDIGHAKEGEHAINGSVIAKEILSQKDFSEKEIEVICECIKTHSLKGNDEPSSIEGKILSDCDRLDVINIDTWIYVIDSKLSEGIKINQAIVECNDWEKEWLSLGTQFFTKKGRERYEQIKREKNTIINNIKEKKLEVLRRGVLIHYFDENLEKIFLVKRTGEFLWGVIAGTSEKNENFIRTAVRELKEEIDVERSLFELFPSKISITFNLEKKGIDVLYNYCIKEDKKDFPKINFSEEIGDLSWYLIKELPKNMIPSDIELNLSELLKHEKGRN